MVVVAVVVEPAVLRFCRTGRPANCSRERREGVQSKAGARCVGSTHLLAIAGSAQRRRCCGRGRAVVNARRDSWAAKEKYCREQEVIIIWVDRLDVRDRSRLVGDVSMSNLEAKTCPSTHRAWRRNAPGSTRTGPLRVEGREC